MSRKKKPLPLLQNITIEDLAAEGKALAHHDGMVVFAPFVVPGDVCDLQLRRKKHSYAEAEAVAIHTFSPERDEPFCPHFGECGGCKWQCLKYDRQIHYKQKQVEAALTRIAKVEVPPISPILGSKQIKGYRNKLEFGFSNRRWITREEITKDLPVENPNAVGFHISGAFDKILDITYCGLMPEVNNRLRNAIRDYAIENNLSFYDIRQGEGLLRNMMLRSSETGELMLLLQFAARTDEEHQQATELMKYLSENFPEVTSLLYVNNLKCNDTIGDLPISTFAGTDFIYEKMEGLRFKVGPKSFYQTNSKQAYELYKVARQMAALTGKETVYDLYTGTGTIALFVSHQAAKVVGIEYVPEAIEDAKENARLNHINNTAFYAGDMKDILTLDFIAKEGKPDVIITDPPRAGMHPDVVRTILHAHPERIVYVSCNPATQARDIAMFDQTYKLVKVQPVDMFPHTHHVENVCLLQAR